MTCCHPKPYFLHDRHQCFLERARAKYGDKFDYSRFDYVDTHTKGTIICPVHGEFLQTPENHLRDKTTVGCLECGKELSHKNHSRGICYHRPKSMTPDEFLKRARDKFGDKYTYHWTEWRGFKKTRLTVICPKHGSIVATPVSHIGSDKSHGCRKCCHENAGANLIKPYQYYLGLFAGLNGDRYIYPESNEAIYEDRQSHITVICRKHGPFEQKIANHLVGDQCRHCAMDIMVASGQRLGGYCEDFFAHHPAAKTWAANLYYISFNDGAYFKIGITRKTVKKRLYGLAKDARDYGQPILSHRIIAQVPMTLYEAFSREQEIIKEHRGVRLENAWSIELFSSDIWPHIQHHFTLDKPSEAATVAR